MRKAVILAAGVLVMGLIGCTHNKGGDSMPTTQATAGMPTTMPASASESMMDKAKDMIQKGKDMLAKGQADNNSDEQSAGQSMIDKGKALLEMAKAMMGSQS